MDRMIYTGLNAIGVMTDSRVSQAQNLANMGVPGFRRDLPNETGTRFLDALDTASTRAFQLESGPAGFSQANGLLDRTGLETDVAISDEGYFFVAPPGGGDPALSRRGDLHRSVDGVLRDGSGAAMLNAALEPIVVPPFRSITVSDLGEISIEPLDAIDGEAVPAGLLATVVPEPDVILRKGQDGMIRAEDGTVPEPNQQAKVLQGVLERSNVNPVEEMLANIELQRNYEIGMRTIMSARDIDEAGTSLMRAPEG